MTRFASDIAVSMLPKLDTVGRIHLLSTYDTIEARYLKAANLLALAKKEKDIKMAKLGFQRIHELKRVAPGYGKLSEVK